MFGVKDSYQPGDPLASIRMRDLSLMAAFLNYLSVGKYFLFNKPDEPSQDTPPCLELNIEELAANLPGKDNLTHEDITDWDDATAEFAKQEDVDELTDDLSDLTDAVQGIADDVDAILADYATGSELDALAADVADIADVVDGILADYLGTADIGVTVAAKSHAHGFITSDGKLSNCQSAGCLVVTDAQGYITHSNSNPLAKDVADLTKQWIDNDRKIGGGEITHDKITDWASATAGFLDGDDYDALAGAIGDLAAELADCLTLADVGVTVARQTHTHTTSQLTDWGSATSGFLTDEDLAGYATGAELDALAADVEDLAGVVDEINTDLAALEDWADGIDADLYDASGSKKWVDLTSNQTVGGSKTFTKTVFLKTSATEYFEIENATNSTRGYFGLGEIWLDKNTGAIPIHFRDFGRVEKARIYYDYSDTLLHLVTNNNNGSGFKSNGVVLSANPTDVSDTSSKVVPTMGWVNNYFSRKTHHHDDVYAKISHTHSGYASTNHTHSGYASSNHNHSGVYANATHQHVAADITDLGSTIDGKITTFSNTVSTTYATKAALNSLTNLVNEIDADLADVIDYVDSMDQDIADLAAWYATGRTGTLTLGGVVSWTGTQLKQDKHVVTFTNGLITNVVTTAGVVIDTPVLFEQS